MLLDLDPRDRRKLAERKRGKGGRRAPSVAAARSGGDGDLAPGDGDLAPGDGDLAPGDGDLAPLDDVLSDLTVYGSHLHSAKIRRELAERQYAVLRKLLPRWLHRLLQRWCELPT